MSAELKMVAAGDEVWAIHPVDSLHLAEVKSDMTRLGAPTIHVTRNTNGFWVALEGCHRMRAAHDLGLVVNWVPIERDVRISIGEEAGVVQLNWATCLFIENILEPDSANKYGAGELADSLITFGSVCYSVAPDHTLVMHGDHDSNLYDDEAW